MKKNPFFLLIVYLLSFFWYFLVFLVIIPWLVINWGQALDYFFFDFIIKTKPLWPRPPIFWQGFVFSLATLFAVLGTVIFIQAIRTLKRAGITFPFSVVTHQDLVPCQLIANGIYSQVRHPMLLGYTLFLTATCLYTKTLLGLVVVLLLISLMLEVLFLTEEKHLTSWFGEEYQGYRQATPALIPKWK